MPNELLNKMKSQILDDFEVDILSTQEQIAKLEIENSKLLGVQGTVYDDAKAVVDRNTKTILGLVKAADARLKLIRSESELRSGIYAIKLEMLNEIRDLMENLGSKKHLDILDTLEDELENMYGD